MSWFLVLLLGLIAFDVIIVGVALIGVHVIKPLYPTWWERNVVANDPEGFRLSGPISARPGRRPATGESIWPLA
ncbi:MAG: hypothetical protein ACE5H9_18780 [Anaerolineae bacterium]